MEINLELISAMLDEVLDRNKVASHGAIPLKTLVQHWEEIRLRSSDLSAGINALQARGRIELERRCDGVWVHRVSERSTTRGAYQMLLKSVRAISGRLALGQVKWRRGDGYSGMDRRIPLRQSPYASAKASPDRAGHS